MYLDLSRGYDKYKRYVVLHEFGHALGLDHEHQSPEALDLIDKKKAVDGLTEKYREALKHKYHGKELEDMAKKEAAKKFQQDYAQRSGGEATEYDPYSIMHCW